jgi:hypothetical protein
MNGGIFRDTVPRHHDSEIYNCEWAYVKTKNSCKSVTPMPRESCFIIQQGLVTSVAASDPSCLLPYIHEYSINIRRSTFHDSHCFVRHWFDVDFEWIRKT